MGAFSYVSPRLRTTMRALGRGSFEDIKYVGRAPSASAATGFPSVHVQEQSELLKKALEPEPTSHHGKPRPATVASAARLATIATVASASSGHRRALSRADNDHRREFGSAISPTLIEI